METAMNSNSDTGEYEKIASAVRSGKSAPGGSPNKGKKIVADTPKYIDTVHERDRMDSA